jgi:hypothetical protein
VAHIVHYGAMAGNIDWLHAYEEEYGYVRVRLALASVEDGGRQTPIASGYRSCWDVSRAGDQSLLTDAPLLIEGAEWLHVGKSAIVRLHPLFPGNWSDLARGRVIGMFEGLRRVGHATVLDIALHG